MPLNGTDIRIIDTDAHLTESPDLWSARFPKRLADQAPRIIDDDGIPKWEIGGQILNTATIFSQGTEIKPVVWDDVDPACYDGPARLRWMDEHGVDAQVLYPNLVAFEAYALMALEPTLGKLIIETYNDHVYDLTAIDRSRLVPIAALPFWDRDAAIAEMRRCAGLGFTGVLWAAQMEKHGLPGIADRSWDSFYAEAQDLGMSINFHVGIGKTEVEMDAAAFRNGRAYDGAASTKRAALSFLSNAETIAQLIMSGLCEQFPDLNFVSVESGFGYLPFLLEALDWQWINCSTPIERSERLVPSEYFRRQIFATFWFERSTLALLDDYADNVMFETDFPHPTSLSPRPYLPEEIPSPSSVVTNHLASWPEDIIRKVLYQNAERLYHL